MGACRVAQFYNPDQSKMVPSGKQIHCHAGSDKRSSKPQGQSVRLHRGSVLGNLKLLQEQSETCDNETKPH